MKLLVGAGFVCGQKRGKWVYYDLGSGTFEAVREASRPFATAVPETLASTAYLRVSPDSGAKVAT